jgi:hypothetical protein
MTNGSGNLLGMILLVVGGVVLIAVLMVVGSALDLAPMSKVRRSQVARFRPLLGLILVVIYVLWAVRKLWGDYPYSVPILGTMVLGVVVAASWFAIRDFIAGVILKAGRACQVGDYVRIGNIHGRIEKMGFRVLSIETSQGDEAILPYSKITRDSLLRTPVIAGAHLHVFQLKPPEKISMTEFKTTIRQCAMLSHWSSVVREPEVAVIDDQNCEVTVFLLDVDHVMDVEAAVRKAVSAWRPSIGRR